MSPLKYSLRDKLNTQIKEKVETNYRDMCFCTTGFFVYIKNNVNDAVQLCLQIIVHISLVYLSSENESKTRDLTSVKCESLEGVQGFSSTQSLLNLKEVRCLDSLVRAHTLLAVMADKTSPDHQLNLLRAYTFVLQIWRVLQLYYNTVLSLNFVRVDETVLQMQIIFDLSMEHASVYAVCHSRYPSQWVVRFPVRWQRVSHPSLLPPLDPKKAKTKARARKSKM